MRSYAKWAGGGLSGRLEKCGTKCGAPKKTFDRNFKISSSSFILDVFRFHLALLTLGNLLITSMSSPDPMGYNLQVLTSIPDLEVKERIDAFLQSLALQFGSELEGVKYEAHDKIECSKLLVSALTNDRTLIHCT